MNNRIFDDETLMAFADGELDAETSARIEAAMETDDSLVEKVAGFMESRARAADALKPLIDEPVPETLMRTVRAMVDNADATKAADNVVAFQPRTAPNSWRWAMPLAASLAVIVAGAGGYLAGRASSPSQGGGTVAQLDDPAISKALDTAPSGNEVGTGFGTMKLVSSFRDEAGGLCREFELSGPSNVVTIACRSNGRWDMRLAVATPTTGTDYVPAGATETIDAYLATIHAGAPLSEAEEAEALGSLRR